MKLAEKIFIERKKLNLSQEQFAEQMEVSRQAVSKWESGQSMPDLDKIILMSSLFEVSTDYLLKEEVSKEKTETSLEKHQSINAQPMEEDSAQESVRRIDEAYVFRYMEVQRKAGIQITIGVSICVLGILLCMLIEMKGILAGRSEDFIDLLEGIAFLGCAAVSIVLFIVAAMALSKYDFLEKQDFILPEGLESRLKKDYDKYHKRFVIEVTFSIVLCIAAVIVAMIISYKAELAGGDALYEDYVSPMVLLIMVAAAVILLIRDGMKNGSYEIVLQMNGYSIEKKRRRREGKDNMSIVSCIYWCIVTAFFLGYSFITEDWEKSWIVWPVAGCLFGAVAAFVTLRNPEGNYK